jgi:hypothetical protein
MMNGIAASRRWPLAAGSVDVMLLFWVVEKTAPGGLAGRCGQKGTHSIL